MTEPWPGRERKLDGRQVLPHLLRLRVGQRSVPKMHTHWTLHACWPTRCVELEFAESISLELLVPARYSKKRPQARLQAHRRIVAGLYPQGDRGEFVARMEDSAGPFSTNLRSTIPRASGSVPHRQRRSWLQSIGPPPTGGAYSRHRRPARLDGWHQPMSSRFLVRLKRKREPVKPVHATAASSKGGCQTCGGEPSCRTTCQWTSSRTTMPAVAGGWTTAPFNS